MTDLSGVQQAVQKIGEQAVQDQGKSGALGKGTASAEDVQKLQDALKQPQETAAGQGVQQPQDVDKVSGVRPPQETAAGEGVRAQDVGKVPGVQQTATYESPGAKILNHMQGVRSGLNEAVQALQGTLANPNAGPAQLMEVQLRLQQVTMQQDLLGKVVAKSEQNVDQLLKGQ